MRNSKKGYTLLLTLVVAFFISLTSLTAMIIVSRYYRTIETRKEHLADIVYVEKDNSL